MKIAACALNQTPLDWEGNLNRILTSIEQAKTLGAGLILFPELALTGYGCEDYFFMPWLYEKAFQLVSERLLPVSSGILLAVGVPYLHQGKRYNCLAICADGKLEGLYAKQILANGGVFYEPRWFEPWPANRFDIHHYQNHSFRFGDFTFSWGGMEIGFEICEDAWHEDRRPALHGAAREADLILNPSASNYARGKQEERHAILLNLAGKHEGYYLYANLLGNESGRLIFDGEILFGKSGIVLASTPLLSMQDSEVRVFDLSWKKGELELAPQAGDFEEFTSAACLGMLDYLRKSGSRGFCLSLSGGADSSACAVLVAEMIRRGVAELGKNGFERKIGLLLQGASLKEWVSQLLVCVYQASPNSGNVTRDAARSLADSLGAIFHIWDIGPMLKVYTEAVESAIGRPFQWETDDLALQNIQARTRAPGIWMLANVHNFLLLTTSNRSEGDVGYCTMDGDTAGSLAPLAGVSKHFIRKWLRWMREIHGYQALDKVIHQAPTAELRPSEQNQTDEADLMPYDLLEEIETGWIGDRLGRESLIKRLINSRTEDPAYLEKQVDRFISLWKRSQWKRERLAPSFHLDRFNIDPKSGGRFPILCR